MKSQTNRAARIRRIALFAGLAVVCLGGTAYALGATGLLNGGMAAHLEGDPGKTHLSIRSQPALRTVEAGQPAAFRILIRRGSRKHLIGLHGDHLLAARVHYTVDRPLPAGFSSPVWHYGTRRKAIKVIFRTLPETAPGSYRFRLRAQGRLRPRIHGQLREAKARTLATIVVTGPPELSFEVNGSTSGPLSPGVSAPVAVELTNPHDTDLTVRDLQVGIDGIDAPQATAGLPCTAGDFTIRQYSGTDQLIVPASSTYDLESLGIPESEWPEITMRNRPVNQDGCKSARLSLSFTATGSGDGS